MGWPSGQKVFHIGIGALILFFVAADIHLYYVIQNEHITQLDVNGTASTPLTPISYFDTNVKSLMLDHDCYYIQHPLAVLVNQIFNIAENFPFITPNLISISHAFVALFSARCIMNESLTIRRSGVLLFELRNFLDSFDGVIARARKNIRINMSEVGSLGYFIDGICDAVGSAFVLLACLFYLNDNLPRYTLLPQVQNGGKTTKKSSIFNLFTNINSKSFRLVFVFSIQLVIGCVAWNRYIIVYHNALEKNPSTLAQMLAAEQVKKSTIMLIIFWLWRLFNAQSLCVMLLIAIFSNKMLAFLNFMQYFGFVIFALILPLTEVHIHNMETYLQSL